MSESLYIGECPVCHHGRQVVRKLRGKEGFIIRCEECESEWASPAMASDASAAVLGRYDSDRLANRDDLKGHSWVEYVVNWDEL